MQNFSWLVQASPAAPPARSRPPTSRAMRIVPPTSVVRAQVAQRLRRDSQAFIVGLPSGPRRSARENPPDHIADLGVVLRLEGVVLLFLAVDLDLGVGRQVGVELLLG